MWRPRRWPLAQRLAGLVVSIIVFPLDVDGGTRGTSKHLCAWDGSTQIGCSDLFSKHVDITHTHHRVEAMCSSGELRSDRSRQWDAEVAVMRPLLPSRENVCCFRVGRDGRCEDPWKREGQKQKSVLHSNVVSGRLARVFKYEMKPSRNAPVELKVTGPSEHVRAQLDLCDIAGHGNGIPCRASGQTSRNRGPRSCDGGYDGTPSLQAVQPVLGGCQCDAFFRSLRSAPLLAQVGFFMVLGSLAVGVLDRGRMVRRDSMMGANHASVGLRSGHCALVRWRLVRPTDGELSRVQPVRG